jgi:demethylmenaquinone methyltransferase/2-methoxy-6-polyprenyl-1,4-benzoquinol methylase/phosphoethanolamine N-methyltransferase
MHHVTVSAPRTRGHTIHWATLYDVMFALMTGGRERTLRARIVALADLRHGAQVLDVGCGTGGLAIAAAERVGPMGAVHAVDASPEMVARARHRAARAGVALTLEVAPVEALPFTAGAFDVVLSSLMLHHLPEDVRAQAFGEIRRVLRPGGRLLAVDFEPPRSRAARVLTRLALTSRMADYDVRMCLPLMRDAGFVDVEAGPTPYRWLTLIRGRVGDSRG